MDTHTPRNEPNTQDDTETDRQPKGPSYRGALVIGAAALLLLVTLAVVAVRNADGGAHTHDDAPAANGDAPTIGHIHGIAAAPAGQVLIGAHYGLFSVDVGSGAVARVGDSTADYMALTDAADPGGSGELGRLLASGHPAVTDTRRPVNLGLMESLDGGRTWEALSLEGAADFHALEHTPERVWGIDSVTGGLMASVDERTWETVHSEPLLDLAADPDNSDRVLATTGDGQLVDIAHPDGETVTEVEVDGAPRVGFIDWPASDVLVGIAADGVVWRSEDGGQGWAEVARVPGDPTALSVLGNRWFAATSDGLFRGSVAPGAGDDVEQVLGYTH